MKHCIKCPICERFVRYHSTYKIRLEEDKEVNPGYYVPIARVVRICKRCAGEIGYRARKKKEIL